VSASGEESAYLGWHLDGDQITTHERVGERGSAIYGAHALIEDDDGPPIDGAKPTRGRLLTAQSDGTNLESDDFCDPQEFIEQELRRHSHILAGLRGRYEVFVGAPRPGAREPPPAEPNKPARAAR
jgi:hypothetical protein